MGTVVCSSAKLDNSAKPRVVFHFDPGSSFISILAFESTPIGEIQRVFGQYHIKDAVPLPYEVVHKRIHQEMDSALANAQLVAPGYTSDGTTEHHLHFQCYKAEVTAQALQSLMGDNKLKAMIGSATFKGLLQACDTLLG